MPIFAQIDKVTNDVTSVSRGKDVPLSTSEKEIVEISESLYTQMRNTKRDGRSGYLWFKDPSDGVLKEKPDNRRTARAISGALTGNQSTVNGPVQITRDIGDLQDSLTLQVLQKDLSGVDTNINTTKFLNLEGLKRIKLNIVNGEVTLPVKTGRSYAVRLESNPDFKMENVTTIEVFSTAFE